MAIDTRIDPDTGFRTHVVTGVFSMNDVVKTLEETYAHADFRADAAALWDLTGATGDPATEEIRHLADIVGKLAGAAATGKLVTAP